MTGTLAGYPLFTASGIEIEYMIVDRDRLDVLPVTDQVMLRAAGACVSDYEDGPIAWSNELVLHVMELKTNGPVATLTGVPANFQASLHHVNDLLVDLNGMLLPTAMHPWMDPHAETRLWPHESSEIYATFNRIFDCRGHGWSNLQSLHLNLPFANEREFTLLHAAMRTLLPIMPAIAASSPLMAGEFTGLMDTRLDAYRRNSARIPCITGAVIPEPVRGFADYQQQILEPIYRALAPHDPEGILCHEWVNARGAIARFERNTIELRVLDTQETPAADLAVATLVTQALKQLAAERWTSLEEQLAIGTGRLAQLLLDHVRDAELTVIRDQDYLRLFAFPGRQCEARELWQYVQECAGAQDLEDPAIRSAMTSILHQGTLARRICRAIGKTLRRTRLQETYRRLAQCLLNGELFVGID